MQEINTETYLEKKKRKRKLKEYQKIIVKLIKAEGLSLIKKCITISIQISDFADLFSYLSMHFLRSTLKIYLLILI